MPNITIRSRQDEEQMLCSRCFYCGFYCNCYCYHHCSARCNEPLVRVYPLRSSHCLGLPHPSRQTQTSLTVTPSGSRFGLDSLNLTLSFDLNFGQLWDWLCLNCLQTLEVCKIFSSSTFSMNVGRKHPVGWMELIPNYSRSKLGSPSKLLCPLRGYPTPP